MTESGTLKKDSYLASVMKICTNRNFLLMLLLRALFAVGTDLSKTPINKFGAQLGATATVLGVVASLYSITQMIGRPIAGRLTDKLNQRTCLVAALGMYVVINLMYSVTTSIPLFVVDRMLYGFASVFVMTGMTAVASAAVDRKAMGTAMGIFLFVPKAVQSVAPLISVNLYNTVGPKSVFYGAAVCCALAACVALFLKIDDEKLVKNKIVQGEKKAFKISDFIAFEAIPVVSIRFFSSFMFTLTTTFLVIYGDTLGIENAAIYFTMYSLLSMWGGIIGGPLFDKCGMDIIAFPMLIGAGVATVLCGLASSITYFMAAGMIFGFTYGMSNPACSAAAINSVTNSRRGVAVATNLLVPDICSVIVGVIIGVLADSVGYGNTFLFMAALPAAGLVYYILMRKKINAHLGKAMRSASEAQKKAES